MFSSFIFSFLFVLKRKKEKNQNDSCYVTSGSVGAGRWARVVRCSGSSNFEISFWSSYFNTWPVSTPIPLNTSDRVLPIKVFVIFVTNAYNILELKKNRSITRDIQPLTNFSLVRPPAAAADPRLYVCPFFHHRTANKQ